MSATDASDSNSDHDVEIDTDFQSETAVQPPLSNPLTEEGLREEVTDMLERLNRDFEREKNISGSSK